jgi:hypothetical protein
MGQVADLDAVSFERPAMKRRRSLVPITALIVVMALAGVRVHHWWTPRPCSARVTGVACPWSRTRKTIWSFPLSTPHPGHADTVTFRGTPEQVWNVNTAGIAVTVNICRVRKHAYESGRFGFNNGPASALLHQSHAGPSWKHSPRHVVSGFVEVEDPHARRHERYTDSGM